MGGGISRDIHYSFNSIAAAEFLPSFQTDRALADGHRVVRNAPNQRIHRPVPHQVRVTEPTPYIAGEFEPISRIPSAQAHTGVLRYTVNDQQRPNFAAAGTQIVGQGQCDDAAHAVSAE